MSGDEIGWDKIWEKLIGSKYENFVGTDKVE
jgi:hypothetical protein